MSAEVTLSGVYYSFFVDVSAAELATHITCLRRRIKQALVLPAWISAQEAMARGTGASLYAEGAGSIVWWRRYNHDCVVLTVDCHAKQKAWSTWWSEETEAVRACVGAAAVGTAHAVYLDFAKLPKEQTIVQVKIAKLLKGLVANSDDLSLNFANNTWLGADSGIWIVASADRDAAATRLYTFSRGNMPPSLLGESALRRGAEEISVRLGLADEVRDHASDEVWRKELSSAVDRLAAWIARTRDDAELAMSLTPMPKAWADTIAVVRDRAASKVETARSALGGASAVTPQAPANDTTALAKARTQAAPRKQGTMSTENFDLVIICALPHTEFEKVLAVDGLKWEQYPTLRDDPAVYQQTLLTTANKQSLRVIAAFQTQKGLPSAAMLATKMLLRFKPTLVAMTGIAAGTNDRAQGFGDILAADQTFDYASGKIRLARQAKGAGDQPGSVSARTLEFAPEPNPRRVKEKIVTRLQAWKTKHTVMLHEIKQSFHGTRPRTELGMHVGPIGSGPAVLSVKEPIDDVIEHWRQLIGIEMEAYGVHLACESAVAPEVPFLCMKSICDFGEGKADEWQQYAAYTSAHACFRFLAAEWEALFPK